MAAQMTLEKETPRLRASILKAIARAADDSKFSAQFAENACKALFDYYTLTQKELAALLNGDIKEIESWVDRLDPQHATSLWRCLNNSEYKNTG
jgi:hypothetical protein